MVELAAELQSRDIDLLSLLEGIDTRDVAWESFFQAWSVLGQTERTLMLERASNGLAAAKRADKVGGR